MEASRAALLTTLVHPLNVESLTSPTNAGRRMRCARTAREHPYDTAGVVLSSTPAAATRRQMALWPTSELPAIRRPADALRRRFGSGAGDSSTMRKLTRFDPLASGQVFLAMKMSVGLVAVAWLLAGCGGTGGDPTDKDADSTATATSAASQEASGGDTISATAWSRRAEAICVKSAAEASTAGKKLARRSAAAGDSKQELAYKVLQLQSKLIDPCMDRVEALPKPEGRERDANRFIASMRNIGDLLGRTATAIKQNDQTNGKRLVRQLQVKTASARSQARALGIEKCNPSPNGPDGSA